MSAPYILFPWKATAPMASASGAPSESFSRWLTSLVTLFRATVLHNPLNVTAAYSANPGDTVRCDTSAGAFAVTLPASSKSTKPIRIIKTSADANAVTIYASGTDKINGAASVNTGAQYGKFSLYPDGVSNWDEF